MLIPARNVLLQDHRIFTAVVCKNLGEIQGAAISCSLDLDPLTMVLRVLSTLYIKKTNM